jgi:DNA-binding LacI/PurR family transcriptional regulator
VGAAFEGMPDGTKMTVTIRDVAREASTSTATVSHVLNSTGRITAETRRRVLAVMKRLKYYPNLYARNLALGSSRTLGMIVSDIENPFFPAVIRAFVIRARHRGYEVIVSNINYEPTLMKKAVERMLERKVRGVAIMTSEMTANLVEELVGRKIAVTVFDAGVAQEYVSTVKMDYLSGVRQPSSICIILDTVESGFSRAARALATSRLVRLRMWTACVPSGSSLVRSCLATNVSTEVWRRDTRSLG